MLNIMLNIIKYGKHCGRYMVLAPIYAYRYTLAAFIGRGCRFAPSCSQYAIEAINAHGVRAGGILALKRIGRCHPWEMLGGTHGYDPIPPKNAPKNPHRSKS